MTYLQKQISIDEINRNPHAYLGPHQDGTESFIRLWRPGASECHFELLGSVVRAAKVNESGLFEYRTSGLVHSGDYRVFHTSGLLAPDPYAFTPTFGAIDEFLFNKGVHYQLYDVMGARLTIIQGIKGTKFALWAPAATQVSLVGDFNHWDGRMNPMRSMGSSGVWELFVPGLKEGEKYKFEIRTETGQLRVKSDPYGLCNELRPNTASVVASVDDFPWEDQAWMECRFQEREQQKPMATYELHLGSWKTNHGEFLNYRDLAKDLVAYCKEMGFTHVELMPIAEHPLDESWGYQVTNFYAVTSRYGTPRDFQAFVNTLHVNGIAVIMDWVPGHFPTDDSSLSRFDGTHLYEHIDSRKGFHPHWKTHIFNYGRHEVANFLIANALFWFDKLHIDGLRVDAVASILYLDYGREHGEWIPNIYGGNENLEAIEFLKHLNSVVHQRFPGVLMIAEESTSFLGVSHPLDRSGLGFDFKWNMGWMNDTLSYFHKDAFYRHYHHNQLTFGLIYAFSEQFILPFSHDEVVHGKGSLISKMPGDYWQKFANLRLLYSYMICQPGKKLLFMGGEIAQWNEWDCKKEMEWSLLDYPSHQAIQRLVKELNYFYREHPPLWQQDMNYHGFEWVDFADTQNSVISYKRKGFEKDLFCVHHFTPQYQSRYFIKLRSVKSVREIFNTDAECYGGSGKIADPIEIVRSWNGSVEGIVISIAPLATQIFEVEYE